MDYLRWIAYLWALRWEDPESENCVFLLLERGSSRDRRITTVQLTDVVVGSEERYIEV